MIYLYIVIFVGVHIAMLDDPPLKSRCLDANVGHELGKPQRTEWSAHPKGYWKKKTIYIYIYMN